MDQKQLELERRKYSEKPKYGTPEYTELRANEEWCDSELLKTLRQCSEKGNMKDLEQWRINNRLATVWLQGASLYKANLNRADFSWLPPSCDFYLSHSTLTGALLEKARFSFTDLKDAWLRNAHLEGAELYGAHLEGADFANAIVDETTSIWACSIDEKTDFTGVALDAARVEPALLARLKTNIRRIAWEGYYKICRKERKEKAIFSLFEMYSLISCIFVLSLIKRLPTGDSPIYDIIPFFTIVLLAFLGKLITQVAEYGYTGTFMKIFWGISDYGSNTSRILIVFGLVALVFTGLYALAELGGQDVLLGISATPGTIEWLCTLFFFSLATMVTLGFGGINATSSLLGMAMVALNLLTGYFLLAVLVTRIGILFQSLGPEQKVSKGMKNEAGEDNDE